MTKERKQLLIPIITIAAALIYSWSIIFYSKIIPTLRHYIGLLLFLIVGYLFLKDKKAALLATGIYLILATFNLLAITSDLNTTWIVLFGSIESPHIQLLSLGILILYCILNIDPLIDVYIAYTDSKKDDKSSSKPSGS
jgi:hypothetical protein